MITIWSYFLFVHYLSTYGTSVNTGIFTCMVADQPFVIESSATLGAYESTNVKWHVTSAFWNQNDIVKASVVSNKNGTMREQLWISKYIALSVH